MALGIKTSAYTPYSICSRGAMNLYIYIYGCMRKLLSGLNDWSLGWIGRVLGVHKWGDLL